MSACEIKRLVSLHGGVSATSRETGVPKRTLYDWMDRGVQPYLLKFIKAYIDQETSRRIDPPPTEPAQPEA